jgi:predicted phage terminase large subunit-like protein
LGENADWSVGTVWGVSAGNYYLLHVERARLETPDLRHRIEQVHKEFGVDTTIIEDEGVGRAIVQDLRRTSPTCTPLLVKVRYEKLARMQGRAVMFETGHVFIPRSAEWLATYLDELLAFPNSAKDDQVDSTSQALDHLQTRFSAPLRYRPEGRKRPKGGRRPPGARSRNTA